MLAFKTSKLKGLNLVRLFFGGLNHNREGNEVIVKTTVAVAMRLFKFISPGLFLLEENIALV